MKSFIIAVIAYSFQIAGAIVLLFFVFGQSSRKSIEIALSGHTALFLDKDKNLIIPKIELQSRAKELYKSRVSIICIFIGYFSAIFMEDIHCSPWVIALCVAILVPFILFIAHLIVRWTAEHNFSDDVLLSKGDSIPCGTIAFMMDGNMQFSIVNSTVCPENEPHDLDHT